jgi:hypothetical protein
MKGWYLRFVIIAAAICYAGTIYAKDMMKTARMRDIQAQESLGPEFGEPNPRSLPEREDTPATGPSKPRYLPPGGPKASLQPKNPLPSPNTFDLATAAQFVRGHRMEARVQGTLYMHQNPSVSIPVLRELLRATAPETRAAAVIALAWMKDPAMLGDIIQLVNDPEPWVRQTLAAGLALFPVGQVVSSLGDLAHDPDPHVRANVAESLGLIGHPEGVEALDGLLDDQVADVRAEAAHSLREIWHPRAQSEALVEPPAPNVPPALREESLKVLLAHLETDTSPEVRRYAAEALGGIGDPSALDPLIARLRDNNEDEFVRYGAAISIGKVGKGKKSAESALRWAQSQDEPALVLHGIYQALRSLKLTPSARPGEFPQIHQITK